MFTYKPEELATSNLYQVRLSIGNTDEYGLLPLQDEEINFFLAKAYDKVEDASIMCINVLITKAGFLVDNETGQISESQSQLLDNLIKTRSDLMSSVFRSVPTYAGITGIDEEERAEIHNDETIFQDGFDMKSEYPGTNLFVGPIGGFK